MTCVRYPHQALFKQGEGPKTLGDLFRQTYVPILMSSLLSDVKVCAVQMSSMNSRSRTLISKA